MLSPKERLEEIAKVVEELRRLSESMPVVVEGMRDAKALALLGISRNVVTLSKGVSLFVFCEQLARRWDEVVVLTDWDRKGGHLARRLKEGLEANQTKVVERPRTQLVILTKKEIKDIESLPTFIGRLRALAGG